MKRNSLILVFRFLIISLTSLVCLLNVACRDMIEDMDNLSPQTYDIKSLSMISVKNGDKTYRLNQYETTYLLWYDVSEWAKENGFTFIQKAEAGLTKNSASPGRDAFFPATKIHPADLITWCNAYSAKNGLDYVYFLDSDKKNPILHSQDLAVASQKTDGTVVTDTEGNVLETYDYSVKAVYANTSANGYRLPTKGEWQYAAQGGKKYGKTNFAGSDILSEVASLGKIRFPGSYKANELGFYDMCGNVSEITLDSSDKWGAYGGHYANSYDNLFYVRGNITSLYDIVKSYPNMFGFRLCQTVVE